MNILDVVGKPMVTDLGQIQIAKVLANEIISWNTADAPPKLHLYSIDVALAPAMVLADLTECVWTGYVAVTLATLISGFDPGDVPLIMQIAPAVYVAPDPLTVQDTVAGYYWTNNASTVLIAVERLEDIFPVDQIGDTISIIARILLPGFTPP